MRSNVERERRFLVADRSVIDVQGANLIVQAYLFSADGYVVRVRRTHWPSDGGGFHDGPAMLSVKGPRLGTDRAEYEMELPVPFAAELMKRSTWKVSKSRYHLVDARNTWDIDVFHGDNEGLIIAECESGNPIRLIVPSWCGQEITDMRRYDNENLAAEPFTTWPDR
jgi:CYTH domain-containing protein